MRPTRRTHAAVWGNACVTPNRFYGKISYLRTFRWIASCPYLKESEICVLNVFIERRLRRKDLLQILTTKPLALEILC
ncbi:hypothetical protein L596_012903 [Steinernema carpocapsae]|uniref:Uncharacterized protein n=1 Tax=Steinernema carpocapsae TaxID=34508 RepID=A0A4U5NYG6_STECR|nr:hypothetical protein L596_012903 [Steinernema carpocapsae]